MSKNEKDEIYVDDFLRLTNSTFGNYGQYHISQSGVTANLGDLGDLADLAPNEAAAILQFEREAKLAFPTTSAELLEWVRNSGGDFTLPDAFEHHLPGDALGVSPAAKSEVLANNAQDAKPAAIDRNEVIAKFRVKSNADENEKFWDDKLGRPPKWLLPALWQRGKAGKSSLWDPLLIAHCLLAGVQKKPFVSLHQLDVMIHKSFPELYETWEEQTEHER